MLYRRRGALPAMSTSHITFRRRVRRGALALAVSAICLPSSALAQGDTKHDYPGTSAPPVTKVGDTPADFPGMSDGPVIVPVTDEAPGAGGFDWTSAAIGAGAAGLLIVVSVGGAGAASRMRMRTVRS
jgi:hypothetical protein